MEITLKQLEILIENGFEPEIQTISGFEKITKTFRKVDSGKFLTFSDGSQIKCANKHLMLLNDEWKTATELEIGDDFLSKTLVDIKDIAEQEWVDFTIDSIHQSYIHNGIIHHNSGKSHIIYLIVMFLLRYTNENILIIVPSISLVYQLIGDFVDYNITDLDIENECYPIMAGIEKHTKKRIVISTWQSLYEQDEDYFSRFGCLFVDECIHPDTLISTLNGDIKIKNIQIGDYVKTINETTNKIEYKQVKKIHHNLSVKEKKYKIKLDNGQELIITGNHKVFTDNGWKRVDELTGKELIKIDYK